MRALSFAFVLSLALLLAGCASYDAQNLSGQNLDGVKRFFVLANANDSRGLAHQVVHALRARDRIAETGPATMMPDDTQLVISYDDQWSWDFGERLVYLQISARGRRDQQPAAFARFATRVPSRRSTPEIVGELVDQLLTGKK